jgi:hypothetical protein
VNPFDAASDAMWDALSPDASGIHVWCSTVLPGCTEAAKLHAKFDSPDVNPFTGARSADHQIVYRHRDAPTLAEGAEIVVDGTLYRVRQEPEIDPSKGMDGRYRCAYLTLVNT